MSSYSQPGRNPSGRWHQKGDGVCLAAGAHRGETPAVGRDGDARVSLVLSDGERAGGRVGGGGFVAVGVVVAAEGNGGDAGVVDHELGADGAGDRLTVQARDWQSHRQAARAGAYVALPAGPDDGVASPHQEAVAGVFRRGRSVVVNGVVEELEAAHVAAIVDVVKDAAVAAFQVDGLEHVDVRGVLDQAVWIPRCVLEVDHGTELWSGGVDGEVDTARQQLVGADVAKLLAFRERLAPVDNKPYLRIHGVRPPTKMVGVRACGHSRRMAARAQAGPIRAGNRGPEVAFDRRFRPKVFQIVPLCSIP